GYRGEHYHELRILMDKSLIGFEGSYDMPGVVGRRVYGYKKDMDLVVEILMDTLPVKEYVSSYFDIGIKTMTYSLKDGLQWDSDVEFAIRSGCISRNSNCVSLATDKEEYRLDKACA